VDGLSGYSGHPLSKSRVCFFQGVKRDGFNLVWLDHEEVQTFKLPTVIHGLTCETCSLLR